MDRDYDIEGAEKRLEHLALDRYNSPHSGIQMSRITSVSAHYEPVAAGRCWNIVLRNTNEELVASFQGIIAKQDLPPFTDKIGRSSPHAKFLRQSVSIMGFDTPIFAKVVSATADIHVSLAQAVGLNNVLECGMINTMNGQTRVLKLSNRYLRPRQKTTTDEVVLPSTIDPHGYLTTTATALGLYHSEDNVVEYFEREGTDDGNYKYNVSKPLIFGIGDIVKVQASFVLFPLHNSKFKSSMVLCSLTLLDGSFTQARMKNLIVHNVPPSVRKPMKHKVGYNKEQLSVTRAKLARMVIDQPASAEDAEGEHLEEGAAVEVERDLLDRCDVPLD